MKDEIVQKSMEYFLKHGIREMSNQKLVELLGISTKTIYKYFKNKEGLLEEVLYLYYAQQQEMIKNLPVEKSAVCLFYDLWQKAVLAAYNVNNAFYRDLHYYYPELGRKVEAATTEKFTKEFLRIIKRGIKEGDFRKDIVPEVVLESVYVQFEAIARSDRFQKFHLAPDVILLNTLATTIRGACTVKGAEVLDEHIQTNQLLVKAVKLNKKATVN